MTHRPILTVSGRCEGGKSGSSIGKFQGDGFPAVLPFHLDIEIDPAVAHAQGEDRFAFLLLKVGDAPHGVDDALPYHRSGGGKLRVVKESAGLASGNTRMLK